MGGFALLGVAQLGRLWQNQQVDRKTPKSMASVLGRDTVIALPDEIGTWYRLQSKGPSLLKVEAFGGITSQVSQYRKGPLVATISLDYPFMGYHDVRICYALNGWEVINQDLRGSDRNVEKPQYLEVMMKKDGFRDAALWFSTIDEKGKWMESSYTRSGMLERFRHELGESTTTYRIQMLVHGVDPLTEAQLSQARRLYEETRDILLAALLPKLNQN